MNNYIADLHLHSHYAVSTSKDLNLESIYQWARIKGIQVVATGDFTHPKWFEELKEKLIADGNGFFKLKKPPKDIEGFKCHDIDVSFCLSTEICSVYKHENKVRKNHSLIYAPDFDIVSRLNKKLSCLGNLEANGRPVLGTASRNLLEIALETSDQCHFIPAHIWTPWFSSLGAKSGYDSIHDCFRDLTGHIFALETGLSSDPEMNWHISALDEFTLISNSDAHSPSNLGREANLFATDLSYDAMFTSIRERKGFLGTYEFFPEAGKYHIDGHRKCNVALVPEVSKQLGGICPACNRPATIGVLHRVKKLADRKQADKPETAPVFKYLIPLPEIISEINGKGIKTKPVQQIYREFISACGNEFFLLQEMPFHDIEKKLGSIPAEAIRRLRNKEVKTVSGFDGRYGSVKLFGEGKI